MEKFAEIRHRIKAVFFVTICICILQTFSYGKGSIYFNLPEDRLKFAADKILSFKFLLPSDDKYYEEINRAAKVYGLDPFLLKAIIKVESDFNHSVVSCKGAIGLMQVMPGKAPQGKKTLLFNPWVNIETGSKYFAYLLKLFKGNVKLALASYNAGPGAVKKYGSIPPFKETKFFVKKVFWFWKYYKHQYGKFRFLKSKVAEVKKFYLDRKLKSAAKLLSSLTKEFPKSEYIYYNLGVLYHELKYDFEAVKMLKKAIKLNPYLKEAYISLISLFSRYGDFYRARKWLKKYSLTFPNSKSPQLNNLLTLYKNNFTNGGQG
jgi:tetratricopeptide (TPR) repeat protein